MTKPRWVKTRRDQDTPPEISGLVTGREMAYYTTDPRTLLKVLDYDHPGLTDRVDIADIKRIALTASAISVRLIDVEYEKRHLEKLSKAWDESLRDDFLDVVKKTAKEASRETDGTDEND